jgi:polysaccharide biosynthesis/export protein
MQTKKWFPNTALIALLMSVAVAQNYPESSPRKGAQVGHSGQGKPRSGVSDNWSGVTLRKLKVLTEQGGVTFEITATRPVTPTLTRLTSPDRLVLDFPNTLSAGHQNVVAVNYGGVKSVRISVQPSDPPMTRLVVDLLQPRTSELVAIGDTIVLKLHSVGKAPEKTAISYAIEEVALLDPPFSRSRVDLNRPYLPGVTLKSTESRDHGSQPSSVVQEPADPPGQTGDSSNNSSVTEGSRTTPISGQEVGQQMPAAGKPPTPDNGKLELQQAVNQALPPTGQGAEPATPANGLNGTVSSPAAAGEMKAAPTNQPLSNTTARSPEVQETADPPTQAQDSSTNSSATGGSGTTANSGQEVGQQMPAAGGPLAPNNGKPEAQQTVDQVLPATAQGAEPATPANGSNGTVSSPTAGGDVKAAPTNQPLSNTTGASPGIRETADPPTQAQAVLASKGAVQATDLNRVLNQAEAGDSTAQYEMAVRCADGEGVPQNYRRAMAWFARAAANGNAHAQWELGLGYLKGIGVPQDERKAAEWFKTAANQGDVRAQSALSDLFFDGRGVPRDYVRAYTWASIAAGLRGNDNDRLKVMGARMTAVQIEDAHRRISSWWELQKLKAGSPASLGGGSGSESASPVVPVSLVADPAPRDVQDTKITTSQNALATLPQAAPQAQQQEQQQAMPGNQSRPTDTPKASREQNAAATIQQPVNAPAQPSDEPEMAKPSPPDAKITSSQNAPVTPPQTPPQPQQPQQTQAMPRNQSSQTDTPTASSEQNAAATQPASAPAQPKHEPELAKPSTPDTKITSSQNDPGTPPQAPPQTPPQQLPQEQQATPGNQSSQTDTPTARAEQNAAETTIQQPVNPPGQPNHQPEPANPSTLGGGPVSAIANSSLTTPMAAVPLNAADVTGTVNRAKQQPSPDEYVIGEQDVLAITVWKERELSGSVVVRPDGKITLPLVDDLQVVGLTTAQLRAVLIEKLKPFVSIPQVTVAVTQINSRKVYLIGEANRTGTFPINSSTTVLQILAQAGGLKDYAKRKNIYVLRNEQGKQVRYRFNYEEVIRGQNSQQNILLQPADTVIVP